MLIVLLLLIWLAALGPALYRRLSERRLSLSVAEFRSRTKRLEHAYPHLVAVADPPSDEELARRAAAEAHRRRLERERARHRAERRRRTLGVLGAALVASLTLGAIPGLHVLWSLSAITALVTAGYLGALAWVTQNGMTSAGRRSGALPVPVATDVGRVRSAAAGFTRRPAFVLVDEPRAAAN